MVQCMVRSQTFPVQYKVLHDPNVLQSLKPIQTKYEGKAIEEGREVFTYISDLNA